jgi:hypothetical protein
MAPAVLTVCINRECKPPNCNSAIVMLSQHYDEASSLIHFGSKHEMSAGKALLLPGDMLCSLEQVSRGGPDHEYLLVLLGAAAVGRGGLQLAAFRV